MRKLQAGLVIEGNSTSSTLLRLTGVNAELGPIKSSSLHVARRVSNFLKAGYAVHAYEDLCPAKIIFIRVPDASIERVVQEICALELPWADHFFVLSETWEPTERLAPLREQGAAVASLVALPNGHEQTFAVEGDTAAVRHARRMIDRGRARSLELKPGTKHLLCAATVLCTALPVPLLFLAQQLLRESGVSGNHLSAAVKEMTEEMLTSFLKGTRTNWGGALSEYLSSCQGDSWEGLDRTHPQLARELRQMIKQGRTYLGERLSRGQSA